MSSEWLQVPLGEVTTLQRGFDLPSRDRRPGKVPIISSSGITGYHSEVGVQGPGVVTGRYGTIGQVFLTKEDFWPLNTTLWVKDFHGNDPLWASYLLRTIDFMSCNDKSSVPGVNRSDLHRILVLRPPLEVQRTIASVLGAFDDKIEQNRRTARTLKRLAQAIFRAWFVDFEPVKAKVEGAASFPSMPQPVFDALPARFVDSDIGPVPEGWEVKTIGESMLLTMGQSPPSEFYNETGEGLPFHQGVTDYGFRFPNHRVYCTTEGRTAEPGDVLLSVRAPVGRINVADRRLILGRGLAGLRHRSGRQSFLYQQICHAFPEEDAIGDGTVYKAVTKRFLEQMSILLPFEDAQEAFENLARPLDDLIATCEVESRKLAETRDLLLPQLLSGRIHVEPADG